MAGDLLQRLQVTAAAVERRDETSASRVRTDALLVNPSPEQGCSEKLIGCTPRNWSPWLVAAGKEVGFKRWMVGFQDFFQRRMHRHLARITTSVWSGFAGSSRKGNFRSRLAPVSILVDIEYLELSDRTPALTRKSSDIPEQSMLAIHQHLANL